MKDTLILAIESSCDETAASVVKNGRTILSNVISSQIALHTVYGGGVPEIASRKHIEKINQVIEQALADAEVTLDDLDAIGVTYGPGLVGALLVGVAEAKAIAYAKKLPLVGVHHIEGHVSANYIEHPDLEPPFLCLIVSGGHTHLVIVKDYGEFEILGRTRDDAAGEAFDKNIEVGAMIEVPSAAITVDIIAQVCDFISIGTNDLIQYLLAVDRVNDMVAHLYEPTHPAVLRTLNYVVTSVRKMGKPVGVCGELAEKQIFAPLLLGMGVTEFSMSANSVSDI